MNEQKLVSTNGNMYTLFRLKAHRMKIREAVAVINRMKTDGIIKHYAIGGAVGATFYLEPSATLDIDIFIGFKPEEGSHLISLKPVFDYLTAHGCSTRGEYILIAGWPVQFLPASGQLVEEALESAIETDLEGEPAWIFSAEHLAAIALQTGRAKDMARVLQFVESGVLDADKFESIISRHGLEGQWKHFKQAFFGDPK